MKKNILVDVAIRKNILNLLSGPSSHLTIRQGTLGKLPWETAGAGGAEESENLKVRTKERIYILTRDQGEDWLSTVLSQTGVAIRLWGLKIGGNDL